MHRDRQLGWAKVVGTALVLVLALAAPAGATKFKMNGTWLMRKGQSFIPLQFHATPPHVSMGSWTEAPWFPTMTPMGGMSMYAQVIDENGVAVDQTGTMDPLTIKVRARTIKDNFLAAIPLIGSTMGAKLLQITSNFEISAPFQPATLMPGGGPGPLTWCPFNPCAFPGTIPGSSTGMGGSGARGRIVYTAGAPGFGGVMRIGLRYGGWLALGITPTWIGHARFGGAGTTLRNLAVGGGSAGSPGTEMVFLTQGPVTDPPIPTLPPSFSFIPPGGVFVTVPFFGNTLTMPTGVKFLMPKAMSIPTTAPVTNVAQFSTNWGFPHTTGTVLVQQYTSAPGMAGHDFFTIMGSDMRVGGIGNVSTVAGGIARRTTSSGRVPYGQFDKVWLMIGPTLPSMSPAGFAATGALMLLGVAYALRRRLA